MEITGKIIVALPEVGGTSKAGNAWRKRDYVLETMETYPKKVAFNFFNDRIDQFPLNVGDEIKLSFDIDSREYNGRWYVEIRAWKAEPANAMAPAAPAYGVNPNMPQGYAAPAQAPQTFGAPAAVPAPPAVDLAPSATDDLPF